MNRLCENTKSRERKSRKRGVHFLTKDNDLDEQLKVELCARLLENNK